MLLLANKTTPRLCIDRYHPVSDTNSSQVRSNQIRLFIYIEHLHGCFPKLTVAKLSIATGHAMQIHNCLIWAVYMSRASPDNRADLFD